MAEEKGPCAYCGKPTTKTDEYGNFKCEDCYPVIVVIKQKAN